MLTADNAVVIKRGPVAPFMASNFCSSFCERVTRINAIENGKWSLAAQMNLSGSTRKENKPLSSVILLLFPHLARESGGLKIKIFLINHILLVRILAILAFFRLTMMLRLEKTHRFEFFTYTRIFRYIHSFLTGFE